jgi:hypothetical protein
VQKAEGCLEVLSEGHIMDETRQAKINAANVTKKKVAEDI